MLNYHKNIGNYFGVKSFLSIFALILTNKLPDTNLASGKLKKLSYLK